MRKVRAVEDALATYSLKSDNLHVAVEALRDLLGADKAFLYSFAQRPDGDDLVLTRAHAAHSVPPSAPPVDYETELNDFLRGRGSDWGGYNVLRPEPEHRDRAFRTSEIVELTGGPRAGRERALCAHGPRGTGHDARARLRRSRHARVARHHPGQGHDR